MEKELILNILSYATRAPSTHNSQPWLFKLQPNGVSVFYDEKLLLPEADKEGRDLYISIGCMLENMTIAAGHFGFITDCVFLKNSTDNHIVDITFKENKNHPEEVEKLFGMIPNRVNARGQFNNEDIFDEVSKIAKVCGEEFVKDNISLTILNKKEDIYKMAELTQQVIHEVYCRPSFRKEVSHWMNSNITTKKEGIPGYALKLPLVFSIIIPVLIRFFNMGKVLGKLNLKSISSAPLVLVFSSPNNNKIDWINTGRFVEKLMLSLQAEGFQTSIFVGAIEIGDYYKQVEQLTGLSSQRPQFIFAVGHIPGKHKITYRHKLEDKIIK